ncbi:radical SAM/SPASM domain-containing protein [Candidatus Bathyarchaeota archaeon]|nr:MAG: radical SAM/SPASM domain-containing protein [Candidatus Bathyarchaeota archaeon]
MMDYYFFKLFISAMIRLLRLSKEEFEAGISDPSVRRGMELVLRSLLTYGVTAPQRLCAPFLIVWNFTNACNLRCKHCYQNAGPKPLPGELTFEEKLSVLNQLDEMEIPLIAFSGGEPTIHPDFIPIVREASRRGIYTAVATNGLAFADESFTDKALKAGLKYVEVSLDSTDPRVHDEFRGVKGAWELAVRGIKNVVKHGGASTGIAMTLTKLNKDQIGDMIRLGEELGVTRVIFFNFIPTGRGRESINLDLTPEEREEALRWIYRESCRAGVQVISTAPQLARVSWQMSQGEDVLPTHFTIPRSQTLRSLAEFIGGCGAGRIYAAIQPDGKVTPCVFMPIIVGDLRKQTFKDIWENNEVMLRLRDKDLIKPPCGECPYRYICGGCRARAYSYYGDYLAPDPGCLRGLMISQGVREEILIPMKS